MSSEPHQDTPLAKKPFFDDADPRYRLCCCHIRVWALVIGVLELLGLFSQLIGNTTSYAQATNGFVTVGGLVGSILGVAVGLVIVSLMMHGVNNGKPLLLIPHMVSQVLAIVGCVAGAIVYFIGSAVVYSPNASEEDKEAIHRMAVAVGVMMLFAAGVQFFFFYVIFRCYGYLKAKYN